MKKIFLDCGAHKGQSVKYFLDHHSQSKEFEIHCFEPNPAVWKFLESLPVIFHKEAIWFYDGEIDFYQAKRSVGSTLMKGKITARINYQNPIKVPCINFGNWIKNNFQKSDYIILKFNIEGAEYKILDNMLKDGSIDYIDELYVDFHAKKIQGMDIKDTEDCRIKLLGAGVFFREWSNFTKDNLKFPN